MRFSAWPLSAAGRDRTVRGAGYPAGCRSCSFFSRLPGRGNDTQGAKRPCFRHGWRSLGSGRPIAAHSRPASSRGPACCDPRSYGTRFVHRPCLDCYCGRSGRGAAYRAALISSTKGSAPMFAGLSKRHVMAALVAFATIAAAGSASAQGQPSPNAILLAKQIVQLKGVGNVMDPIARGVVEKVKSTVMQTNFMFQKDINDITVQLHKEFDGRSSELVDQTAQLYASRFTEPELKQILTYYQSPLGKKMLAEEPQILDDSMRQITGWADNLSIDIMARMRDEMKKRGHDI